MCNWDSQQPPLIIVITLGKRDKHALSVCEFQDSNLCVNIFIALKMSATFSRYLVFGWYRQERPDMFIGIGHSENQQPVSGIQEMF
jgi:hypothetical protein